MINTPDANDSWVEYCEDHPGDLVPLSHAQRLLVEHAFRTGWEKGLERLTAVLQSRDALVDASQT